ncbi:glycosyltransferase [Methylopila sp. M107]|uniref:glycosyltransferase n=1 Tax=Methylopila sp. M107 TaxID=1101190 RepID=UPI00039A7EAF|nr:glycosyltransferase [Methylopila sp. M107]
MYNFATKKQTDNCEILISDYFNEVRPLTPGKSTNNITSDWKLYINSPNGPADDWVAPLPGGGIRLSWDGHVRTIRLFRWLDLPEGTYSEATFYLEIVCPFGFNFEQSVRSISIEEEVADQKLPIIRFLSLDIENKADSYVFSANGSVADLSSNKRYRLAIMLQPTAGAVEINNITLNFVGESQSDSVTDVGPAGDAGHALAQQSTDAFDELPAISAEVEGFAEADVRDAAENAEIAVDDGSERPTMLVVPWEVSHNPLGRAYVLADMARRDFDVSIAGPHFPQYGNDVWPPLRNAEIEISTFPGRPFPHFAVDCLQFACSVSPDVVYITKARLPSLLLGSVVSLLHGSRLVLDIDEHELAFFSNGSPLTIHDALGSGILDAPEATNPCGEVWTRIAESLVPLISARTVVNQALQKKFGGTLLRHVRDEKVFVPDATLRDKARSDLGLSPTDVAVLFIGTPRRHKGLINLLKAIEKADNSNIVLVIVGTFQSAADAADVKKFKSIRTKLIEDQPWDLLKYYITAADLIPVLQDPTSNIAQSQTPAKISEALALGTPIVATNVGPLQDLIERGAVHAINSNDRLAEFLTTVKPFDASRRDRATDSRRRIFGEQFSYAVGIKTFRNVMKQENDMKNNKALANAVSAIMRHYGVNSIILDHIESKFQ